MGQRVCRALTMLPQAPLQVLLPALQLATPLVNAALPLLRPLASLAPQPPSIASGAAWELRARSESPALALLAGAPLGSAGTSAAPAARTSWTPAPDSPPPPSPPPPAKPVRRIAMRPLGADASPSPGAQSASPTPAPASSQPAATWMPWQRSASGAAAAAAPPPPQQAGEVVAVRVVAPLPDEQAGPVQEASYTDVGSGSSFDEQAQRQSALRSRSPSPTPAARQADRAQRLEALSGAAPVSLRALPLPARWRACPSSYSWPRRCRVTRRRSFCGSRRCGTRSVRVNCA